MAVFIQPEEIRRRIGLSRAQWSVLTAGPEDGYEDRCLELHRAFERFLTVTRRALDRALAEAEYVEDGRPYLSTIQAARILGVGEFHLANLRARSKLGSTKLGRRSVYSREDIEAFLAPRETRNGALANSFLRWYNNPRRRPEAALAGA